MFCTAAAHAAPQTVSATFLSAAGVPGGMRKEIDEETLKHYIALTERALKKARISPPGRSHLLRVAEDFYGMAESYWKDAVSFMESGDYVQSFGAVYYAHAWLDAAARLGLIDVDEDDQLFTLAE